MTVNGNGNGRHAGEVVGEAFTTPSPIWEIPPRPFWVKLINTTGRGLKRLGVRWPRLDPDAMIAQACKRSGLSDLGENDFREGLERLIAAFEARDVAHAFGRVFFREYCTGLLINRLKIQRELTDHPEILDVPIHRPIFITGLPRSGTTFLHRLMSEDPAGRTMLFWESLEPAPAPTLATYKTDERIGRAKKQMELLYRLSPRLATAHEFDAESPEEDNNLFAHRFHAGILGFMFDVPDYIRWLNQADLTPGYRYMKRQLQLLSWKYRADYWVIKAPAHMYGLDSLLTVFPDASIVMTHRNPLQVLPSLCSLAAGFRGMITDRVDLRKLGEEFVEAMALGAERALAVRAKADPARFCDVRYPQLIAEPLNAVRDVCQHFGYQFTPEYEAKCRRWLGENPQHKHGVHRYSLGDFGLSAEAVNREFNDYRAWLSAHLAEAV